MPFERILVAIDGSDGSDHALQKALELASTLGARLVALAVEGPLPAYAATIAKVSVALGARGSTRIQTLPALSIDEFVATIE